MTPLRILQDIARAQGNPALPLMVPDAVRARPLPELDAIAKRRIFSGNPPHSPYVYGWTLRFDRYTSSEEKSALHAHGFAFSGGRWQRSDDAYWGILLALHDSGAIELRPDAGNALSTADLALCPRGAHGVPLVTLVVLDMGASS